MGTTPRRRKKRCLEPPCNGGCASTGYPPSSRRPQTDGPCRSTCSASRLSQTKRIRLRPPAKSSATGPERVVAKPLFGGSQTGAGAAPAGQPNQRARSGSAQRSIVHWDHLPNPSATLLPPRNDRVWDESSSSKSRRSRPQTRVRRHVSAAQRDRRVDGHVRRGLEPFRRAWTIAPHLA